MTFQNDISGSCLLYNHIRLLTACFKFHRWFWWDSLPPEGHSLIPDAPLSLWINIHSSPHVHLICATVLAQMSAMKPIRSGWKVMLRFLHQQPWHLRLEAGVEDGVILLHTAQQTRHNGLVWNGYTGMAWEWDWLSPDRVRTCDITVDSASYQPLRSAVEISC